MAYNDMPAQPIRQTQLESWLRSRCATWSCGTAVFLTCNTYHFKLFGSDITSPMFHLDSSATLFCDECKYMKRESERAKMRRRVNSTTKQYLALLRLHRSTFRVVILLQEHETTDQVHTVPQTVLPAASAKRYKTDTH